MGPLPLDELELFLFLLTLLGFCLPFCICGMLPSSLHRITAVYPLDSKCHIPFKPLVLCSHSTRHPYLNTSVYCDYLFNNTLACKESCEPWVSIHLVATVFPVPNTAWQTIGTPGRLVAWVVGELNERMNNQWVFVSQGYREPLGGKYCSTESLKCFYLPSFLLKVAIVMKHTQLD